MKNSFLIFIAVFFISMQVYSQEQLPKFVYCEIVGTSKLLSKKITIQIDFGQESKFFEDNRMKNDSGKPIVFNSMIDALNFMGKQGWEFTQAYTVTIGNNNVYHYLMKKEFVKLDDKEKQEYLKQN